MGKKFKNLIQAVNGALRSNQEKKLRNPLITFVDEQKTKHPVAPNYLIRN